VKVNSLGFRTDLMLRRLADSVIEDRGSHLVVRSPANADFHWGNFVLFDAPPAPGDAARWAAVFADAFPGAGHLALGVDGTEGDAGDPAVHAALGVDDMTYSVLTATELGELVSPAARGSDPGADIRPLDGDDDWALALGLRLSCEELPLPPEHRAFLAARYAEFRALCEAAHGQWFGAFVDEQLCAGGGLFTDGGGEARFQNVETSPAFRRRGLAASVVHHAGRWGLRDGGARTLVIAADPDYHAIRIYRALGFAEAERQVQLYGASR
jgi:ribosomal protein S18 acetylase RimI-like enzyme